MGFKSAREKCGMTQSAVARALGIDQSTICLWEIGKTKPRASLLPKIAELFGCTVDDLLKSNKPKE